MDFEDMDGFQDGYNAGANEWEYDGETFQSNKALIQYLINEFTENEKLSQRISKQVNADEVEAFYGVSVVEKFCNITDREKSKQSNRQQVYKILKSRAKNFDVGDNLQDGKYRGVKDVEEPDLYLTKDSHNRGKLVAIRVEDSEEEE